MQANAASKSAFESFRGVFKRSFAMIVLTRILDGLGSRLANRSRIMPNFQGKLGIARLASYGSIIKKRLFRSIAVRTRIA